MSLTLLNMRVGPFAGISHDHPVVIQFPPVTSKTKKRPISKVTGDQGLGKSSFMHFLLMATAQKFGVKKEDLINQKTGKLKGELVFKQNGETWKVAVTETTFKLFRYLKIDDEEGWIPQGDEVNTLKELIGNVAVSPMKLKTDDGEKQVDWLFKMLNVPDNIVDEAKKISMALTELSKSRASANREYLFLKKSLSENTLYVNWENSEQQYKQPKTIDTAKRNLEVAEQNRAKIAEAKVKLERYEELAHSKLQEIALWKAKIEAAEKEIQEIRKAQEVGQSYLVEHADVEPKYLAAHKEFLTVGEYIANYGLWQRVKQDSKDMEKFEDVVQKCDTKKAELVNKRRALLKNIVELEGLEVVTENEIDGKRTGIYLDGKNPNQLSESELFDLYFKLCRAQGVTMVVIENITSFGSEVVQTLNEFAKAGIYVWATEMARGQKELKIEFIDQIK